MESPIASNITDVNRKDRNFGYLEIKVPTPSRGRRLAKAWRTRWVDIEIISDKFIVTVYISEIVCSRREPPLYRRELKSKKIVIFRSHSKSHPYAFSIAEENEVILYLSAYSETDSQKWMYNLRNMLWPPNQVLKLENILAGIHEVSIIDNEFSQRAGLLGSYGYFKLTDKKIILIHPHFGNVIQEWYFNSIVRFKLLPSIHKDDQKKIFSFETGSTSSTGQGILYLYSENALIIIKNIGSALQQVLEKKKHLAKTSTEQEQYCKDLLELESCLKISEEKTDNCEEEHYQVPRKEIRSVLDIPNFTFERPLSDVVSELQLRGHKQQLGKQLQRYSCPVMKTKKQKDDIFHNFHQDIANCENQEIKRKSLSDLITESDESDMKEIFEALSKMTIKFTNESSESELKETVQSVSELTTDSLKNYQNEEPINEAEIIREENITETNENQLITS